MLVILSISACREAYILDTDNDACVLGCDSQMSFVQNQLNQHAVSTVADCDME